MSITFFSIIFICILAGFLIGAITAFLICHANKKSVVQKPKHYTQKDREQFTINNDILLSGKEEHAAKDYK